VVVADSGSKFPEELVTCEAFVDAVSIEGCSVLLLLSSDPDELLPVASIILRGRTATVGVKRARWLGNFLFTGDFFDRYLGHPGNLLGTALGNNSGRSLGITCSVPFGNFVL